MTKRAFRYLFLCMGIYLALAAIEIFLLRPLVDMISTKFWWQLLIYSVLLLLVDPFVTAFIADRFDPDRKIENDEDA